MNSYKGVGRVVILGARLNNGFNPIEGSIPSLPFNYFKRLRLNGRFNAVLAIVRHFYFNMI